MKATEAYIVVVLFIMLNNVVQTFESVEGILNWGHNKHSFHLWWHFFCIDFILRGENVTTWQMYPFAVNSRDAQYEGNHGIHFNNGLSFHIQTFEPRFDTVGKSLILLS